MTMTTFTPVQGIVGGLLIGAAAAVWLWLYGRVAGISGMLGGAVLDRVPGERLWRLAFLLGLMIGAAVYARVAPAVLGAAHFRVDLQVGWPTMIVAGLLVGFGTRMGNGCTSGHGVCGIARLSKRSMAATVCFTLLGFVTTGILRHLLGWT